MPVSLTGPAYQTDMNAVADQMIELWAEHGCIELGQRLMDHWTTEADEADPVKVDVATESLNPGQVARRLLIATWARVERKRQNMRGQPDPKWPWYDARRHAAVPALRP